MKLKYRKMKLKIGNTHMKLKYRKMKLKIGNSQMKLKYLLILRDEMNDLFDVKNIT